MIAVTALHCPRSRRIWVLIPLLVISNAARAQLSSDGIFDQAIAQVAAQTSYWQSAAREAASRLFLYLAAISLVWTFGFMALRRADIGEFFAELVRFLIVLGFFWWLLDNGPAIGSSIIDSMRELGARSIATAPGAPLDPGKFSPSSVVDIGFEVLRRALESASATDPIASFIGIGIALFILAMTALTAFNMLLLLVSGYFLLYGGVFFLGFGGSRWTSEMALNWYRTVLGLGASLFGMALVVGVFSSMLTNSHARLSQEFSIAELAVLALVAMLMLLMTRAVPSLFAGLISGASIGQVGQMGVSAGSVLTAGAAAATVAAAGLGAVVAGAANVAGVSRAIASASRAAQSSSPPPPPSSPSQVPGAPGAMLASNEAGPDHAPSLAEAMGPPSESASPTDTAAQQGPVATLGQALAAEIADRWDARVSRTMGGHVAARIVGGPDNSPVGRLDPRAPATAPPRSGIKALGQAVDQASSTGLEPIDVNPGTISRGLELPPEVTDYVQRTETRA